MFSSDSPWLAQVRLLVRVLPVVARESCFALKGGTAINLFVRDMPRLSVDIDLAYLPLGSRPDALAEIDAALGRIRAALENPPYACRVRRAKHQENHLCGLQVVDGPSMVKVEVSPVLRGCVYPDRKRRICQSAEAEFGFAEVPVLSFADLYAGKLVAALDRQHPRDLFDVSLLLASEGLTDELFRAFLVYLISHDGAISRLLNPSLKPLEGVFERQFVGMPSEPIALNVLEEARVNLLGGLRARLGDREKRFLISFKKGAPRWELLGIDHAADLPAVKWKLQNIQSMDPKAHRTALAKLEEELASL